MVIGVDSRLQFYGFLEAIKQHLKRKLILLFCFRLQKFFEKQHHFLCPQIS